MPDDRTDPNTEPVPSPEDALQDVLGGMKVGEWIADEPKPPAPEPTPASIDELRALQEKIAKLEENANQQHSNWNQEHMARLNAQAMADSIKQLRDQEAAQAQAIAAMQPPRIDIDWEEAYNDPEKIGEAVQQVAMRYAEWGRNQAMGMTHPAVQEFQGMRAAFEPMRKAAIRSMMNEAEMVLREKHGVTDFAEYRDRIEQEFANGGAQGMQMMSDPENIARVYGMMAITDGKPFNPVEKSDAPIHAGGDPSFSRQTPRSNEQLPPHLRNIWNEMSGSFPGVPAPTMKDLEDMGIDTGKR